MQFDNLRLLFSTLILYRHNLQILHWKIKGIDFDTKHTLAEDYTNKFNEFIDEIAEIMLMLGDNPFGLEEAVKTVKDSKNFFIYLSGEKEYSNREMIIYIRDMFSTLMGIYEKAKNEVPSDIQSKLDEHIYWLRLEDKYKNTRRLK